MIKRLFYYPFDMKKKPKPASKGHPNFPYFSEILFAICLPNCNESLR